MLAVVATIFVVSAFTAYIMSRLTEGPHDSDLFSAVYLISVFAFLITGLGFAIGLIWRFLA